MLICKGERVESYRLGHSRIYARGDHDLRNLERGIESGRGSRKPNGFSRREDVTMHPAINASRISMGLPLFIRSTIIDADISASAIPITGILRSPRCLQGGDPSWAGGMDGSDVGLKRID
jgi:hypothetical protein